MGLGLLAWAGARGTDIGEGRGAGGTTSGNESEGGADRVAGGAAMVGGLCGWGVSDRVHGLDVRDQLYVGVGAGVAAQGMDTDKWRAAAESGLDSAAGGAVDGEWDGEGVATPARPRTSVRIGA